VIGIVQHETSLVQGQYPRGGFHQEADQVYEDADGQNFQLQPLKPFQYGLVLPCLEGESAKLVPELLVLSLEIFQSYTPSRRSTASKNATVRRFGGAK
jgi:hypothetical protein